MNVVGAPSADVRRWCPLVGLFAMFAGCGGGGGASAATLQSFAVNPTTATLTVTAPALTAIAVTGSLPSIAVGQSESFSATGTYTDGSTQNLTTQVSWTSSSVAIGTINPGGVATAVSSGSTSITATLGGVSGAANLNVSYATLGLTWPVATYEAEAGTLGGAASIVGAADGSDRAVGDLGGEASQRQAVLLTQVGDTV